MTDKETVLYQERKGLARITLNRPEALNAMNGDLLQSLDLIVEKVMSNSAVKALIITGAGDKAFSAGADIRFLANLSPLEVRQIAQIAVSINHKIETLGKPVVSAINGSAIGGGLELAEACMLRVAASHVQLGHPEVGIGAVAGFGGTTRLPRLIGKGRAAEMLLTGTLLTAVEAFEMGLVNRVVDPQDLLSEAEALIMRILSQSPIAVKLTWEAIHRGLNMTLEESTLLGTDYFGLIASSDDFRQGTKAFLEKRKPVFNGK